MPQEESSKRGDKETLRIFLSGEERVTVQRCHSPTKQERDENSGNHENKVVVPRCNREDNEVREVVDDENREHKKTFCCGSLRSVAHDYSLTTGEDWLLPALIRITLRAGTLKCNF